ncbi:MAG: bifunctional [glutamine synthetase] adenylyltransferase/[glutamine synthetase]-adenylyl-L-tyrosine phosphorylase [Pseudomonadota bacterium]
MPSLTNAITSAPIPVNIDRADSAVARLEIARGTQLHDLIHGATGASPYLARLTARHADWLSEIAENEPTATFEELLKTVRSAASAETTRSELLTILRSAKSRAALLIALADLGGVWPLMTVTNALTSLADTCAETTARWLLAQELDRDRLPGLDIGALDHGAGYTLLAMGKMGAGELNYSSDIDLIALFDETLFERQDAVEAKARYIHVTRQLVQILSENTSAGYVFRTDLRLRPSPSTTPVCMAMGAAEGYYESVGRTWERAAHIKARPLVDRTAGGTYLEALTPFVWRRHLDFAAIEDTHEMLRKIREQKARFTIAHLPGHDLKLGPGGIREIEFFAQTRQLITGGRDPALRMPTTLGALDALTGAGWISDSVRDALSADYIELRTIEHRLQMLEDAQTHSVPTSEEARRQVAALCGESDIERFESGIVDLLKRVHGTTEEFYLPVARSDRSKAPVEIVSAESLGAMNFARPEDALRQIERWDEGGIAATRSDRARELFLKLRPQILERLAGASDPDQALVHFDRFLSGLPAGVQVFSLFSANPNLLDLIVEICATAPRLALYLGRRPQTLDAFLDQDFWSPLPSAEILTADLVARLALADDYERKLDEVRRWAREMRFRAGVQVLRGTADNQAAGRAFTSIAVASVDALLPHVIDQFAERHGRPPGLGMSILAMGKLGSGEMTSGSDLDLIIIYDADGALESDGRKPLSPGVYYPRLTQSLVAALTAPTAEGALYEVDMRLRPSGRQGPVAVSFASFESYQTEEAWVWEHLALMRASLITGSLGLRDRIEGVIGEVLRRRTGSVSVMTEALEMRDRIADARETDRKNSWDLKQAEGGILEIEFTIQTGCLMNGLPHGRPMYAQIEDLANSGWLDAAEAGCLREALEFQQSLQQVERIALEDSIVPETLGAGLQEVMARAVGAESFDAVSERLRDLQQAGAAVCTRVFKDVETVKPD